MIEPAGKDKISLTILSDETVCQRNYASIGADITKTGEEYTQTTFANSDFTSAFDKIQQLLTDYESAGYITQEQMSLGKRPAAVPAPAIEEKKKNKRETKADGKTTEATRKSSRLVA